MSGLPWDSTAALKGEQMAMARDESGPVQGERQQVVPVETLRAFCEEALVRSGVGDDDAATVADVLVASDLRGVMTHGVSLLGFYVPALLAGDINPTAEITVVRDDGATSLLDADGALGQLAGVRAAEGALGLAQHHGIGCVAVRNSRHWGAAAYYVGMLAQANTLGMAFSLGAGNCMAPWGGLGYIVGNHPIAIAAPSSDAWHTPVVDMALSQTCRTRVIREAEKGGRIPAHWATDGQGNPTTDPNEAAQGYLAPIGEHKGYALAVGLSMVAGALPGASIGSQMQPFFDIGGNSGHTVICIDIERFRALGDFTEDVSRYLGELASTPPLPGNDQVVYPGQLEGETAARRRAEGVSVDRAYLEILADVADTLDMPRFEPAS